MATIYWKSIRAIQILRTTPRAVREILHERASLRSKVEVTRDASPSHQPVAVTRINYTLFLGEIELPRDEKLERRAKSY